MLDRPLNRLRRVDIESPTWHDTKESDGSTIFTKNLLKKKFIALAALKIVDAHKAARAENIESKVLRQGLLVECEMVPLNELKKID